jgi:hypothetical protein
MPDTITAPPAASSSPAPSAPAPASSAPAPVSSPAAPAAVQPAPQDPGREQTIEEKIHAGWEKAKAAVPVEVEAPDAAAAAGLPAEKVEAAPAEVVQSPAGEQTPEEIAAAAKAAEEKAAAGTVEDTTPIDTGDSLAPKEFADKIKGSAAEEFFNANPDVRDMVFGALRRDTDNREIRQIIPDVATAKTAVAGASRWNKFDGGFLDATTPEKADGFLSGLIQMAVETDDQGQPILDNGNYKFHPALPTILNRVGDKRVAVLRESMQKSGKIEGQVAEIFADGLKVLEAQVATLGGDDGERLQAALDIIRGVLPAAPQPQDEPQDIKETRAALKAKEQALSRQGSEQQEAEAKQAIDRAGQTAYKRVADQLKPLFTKSGLQGTVLDKARAEIGTRIDQTLEAHPLYQTLYDGIERRLMAATDPAKREAIEKELTAHELLYSQPLIGPIAAKVLKEFTAPALKVQTDKEAVVAGQVHASRTDARGASVSTSPGKVMTPAALREQITAEYRAKNGADAELPEGYLIREMQKRSGVFTKPA